MTTELTITTERIDDFPLLLSTMQRLGLPAILLGDRAAPAESPDHLNGH